MALSSATRLCWGARRQLAYDNAVGRAAHANEKRDIADNPSLFSHSHSPSQNCAARKLTVVWCVIRHEMIEMRRREVMFGLTAAVGWPPSARAQQRQLPLIGLLGVHKGSFDGIVRSLAERGYVDGKTVVIEQRQAEGQLERLPALAQELVSLPVDIIVSVPAAATVAARQATATIPIVMVHAGEAGLIESLGRP